MGTTTKTLYDTDFAEWSARTAELLRAGRYDELDIENVAEEIESLGKAERKSVRAQLQRLMMHKLKQQIQPERDGNSWRASIAEARRALLDDIEDSPSLLRHLEDNLQKLYQRAIEDAMRETGIEHAAVPDECPWALDALLER